MDGGDLRMHVAESRDEGSDIRLNRSDLARCWRTLDLIVPIHSSFNATDDNPLPLIRSADPKLFLGQVRRIESQDGDLVEWRQLTKQRW